MTCARLRALRWLRSLLPMFLVAALFCGTATTAAAQSQHALLADLEVRLSAAEATGGHGADLSAIELEAHNAVQQATSASERIQGRRILRRVRRLADSVVTGTTNPVAQVGYTQYAEPAVPATAPAVTQPPGQDRLQRFAQIASNLAQYGAPPEDPMLQPVPMGEMCTVPMAVCPPPPTRHFLRLDALGWWVKGDSLPPLVTTSPIGTPQGEAGVLGEPNTSILYGNQKVNAGTRWGGRAQGGVWLDDFQTFALEGHYYGLATKTANYSRTSTFSAGSLDDPILARPFYNANPLVDAQSSVIIAYPDYVFVPPIGVDIDGSINVREQSRIQSAGGGVRYAIGQYNAPARLFLLGGYRFFDLNESLTINASSTGGFRPLPIPDDGPIQAYDSFSTQNIFNGGEIGIGTELSRSRWSLAAETRLAMGNMNQKLTIDGQTSAIYNNFMVTYAGGLLAMPSNIGTYTQNKFALIPQLDVKLGFQLFPALRLTLGYNFTYVSSVLRPGDQVDLNVNPTQVAGMPLSGPAVPAVLMDTTGIWLQGITMGGELRF